MKKILLIATAVALLAACGIGGYRYWRLSSVPTAAWRCLRHPQQMILYSVHPEEERSALAGARLFHGYRILGEVAVSKPSDQERIAGAIQSAVLHFPNSTACFNPRHALHVSDGLNTYDLLICFECGAMECFAGEEDAGATSIGGPPDVLNSILAVEKSK